MFVWQNGELDKKQEDAIRAPEDVFLVACPGSGKTRTLTYKIAFELSRPELKRQFVIAITYTHRAADEIRERIGGLGVDTKNLWIGTIHSFCLEWILKPYYMYHAELRLGFSILNGHESEELRTELASHYEYPTIRYRDCEYYYTQDGYALTCRDDSKLGNVHQLLEQYFALLKERKQIDFEQLLYFAYQLISENTPIRKILANNFAYVLMDEYQDTKAIQYAIVALILKGK